MTQQRDIERLLDDWFSDGPSAVPDRVIDIVADRLERQPQRPAWRLHWREIHVNRTFGVVATAAAVIAIVLMGFSLLGGGGSPSVGGPAASPTTSSTSAPTPAATSTPRVTPTPAPTSAALGQLPAGTFVTHAFPYRATYTVPAGWENPADWDTGFVIRPTSATSDSGIDGWTGMAILSQADGCPDVNEPGRGHAAADFVDFLKTNPGLKTSKPTSISIGGLQGTMIDLAVAPTWTRTCPYSEGKPYVPLIKDNPGPGVNWGIGGKERMRMIILDAGGGNVIGILVDSIDGATFDALVAQAMPVIESMTFGSTK